MKRIGYYYITIQIINIFLFSCTSRNDELPFGKEKWTSRTDPAFPPPYRSRMTVDLTKNHELVGLKYRELVEMLGVPDYKDSVSLSYMIIVKYGHDIDPVYTKNLDFTFSKDSIITSFRFEEWKKKR